MQFLANLYSFVMFNIAIILIGAGSGWQRGGFILAFSVNAALWGFGWWVSSLSDQVEQDNLRQALADQHNRSAVAKKDS